MLWFFQQAGICLIPSFIRLGLLISTWLKYHTVLTLLSSLCIDSILFAFCVVGTYKEGCTRVETVRITNSYKGLSKQFAVAIQVKISILFQLFILFSISIHESLKNVFQFTRIWILLILSQFLKLYFMFLQSLQFSKVF